MDILEIRTLFAKLSGRYDLVDPTTFADTGADFYINAGQRFLERLAEITYREEVKEVNLNANNYIASLIRPARAIYRVVAYFTDGKRELVKKSLSQLQEAYGKSFGDIDSGAPLWWALPTVEEATMIKSLIVLPSTDTDITVKIYGQFYAPNLSSDPLKGEEESFWTLEAPELLVNAALYQLEVMYRNTEGARDWLGAIQTGLTTLDMDGILSSYGHINEMEG